MWSSPKAPLFTFLAESCRNSVLKYRGLFSYSCPGTSTLERGQICAPSTQSRLAYHLMMPAHGITDPATLEFSLSTLHVSFQLISGHLTTWKVNKNPDSFSNPERFFSWLCCTMAWLGIKVWKQCEIWGFNQSTFLAACIMWSYSWNPRLETKSDPHFVHFCRVKEDHKSSGCQLEEGHATVSPAECPGTK